MLVPFAAVDWSQQVESNRRWSYRRVVGDRRQSGMVASADGVEFQQRRLLEQFDVIDHRLVDDVTSGRRVAWLAIEATTSHMNK